MAIMGLILAVMKIVITYNHSAQNSSYLSSLEHSVLPHGNRDANKKTALLSTVDGMGFCIMASPTKDKFPVSLCAQNCHKRHWIPYHSSHFWVNLLFQIINQFLETELKVCGIPIWRSGIMDIGQLLSFVWTKGKLTAWVGDLVSLACLINGTTLGTGKQMPAISGDSFDRKSITMRPSTTR